ncbi:cell division protein ZapA [Bacteroidetes/Chlorobi group bacterium ChocPot_Mid]|jgi:cell division protein ZapA (FtsZ GTPase activity inhibitor)|nr:MAG: cell division protein ZapA [Bacteroidetes/Chlorobi group bacterium ChocPot_Mid]
MAEKIRVKIRGKEYLLKGDDELTIQKAGDMVNSEIESLGTGYLNQAEETIAILAALNIAEKNLKLSRDKTNDENYLITELDRMAKYLDEAVSK